MKKDFESKGASIGDSERSDSRLRAERILNGMRTFFATGRTYELSLREAQLRNLERAIVSREEEILAALKQDLNKSPTEAYMAEIALVLAEIRFMYKNLKRMARPRFKWPSLSQMPGALRIRYEPYGVVLIISPWNYPFQLTLSPLVAAITAGNCAIIKPSAYSPATSALIKSICDEAFLPELVQVLEGGREENRALLDLRFDYIFFTGSPAVGRTIMTAAARNLTPVTLELGGKSPALVDKTADIPKTAKRILFGKLMNAGQTCVAPDYVYVEKSVKDQLITELLNGIESILADTDYYRDSYCKVVKSEHFAHLHHLLAGEHLLYPAGKGQPGQILSSEATRQIYPVLVNEPDWESPLMQEEIFGPVLPILSWENEHDMLASYQQREKPLALYVFSNDERFIERSLATISSGGACINDTLLHMASHKTPFGGVGNSGMGKYHGESGFQTFSHERTILKKWWSFDFPMRHPPYSDKTYRRIKKIMK